MEAEVLMRSGTCELVIFGGGSDAHWLVCHGLQSEFPQMPFLYIFASDDPREKLVSMDELRAVVRPLSARDKFLKLTEQLIRVGRMASRVVELSHLAQGSEAVDQMFNRLDVHHILDKTLQYFGSRLEVENIHWIRWGDVSHILQGDHKSLSLEMEMTTARSPRLMSWRETDLDHLFHVLWQSLQIEDLPLLLSHQFRTSRRDGKQYLFLTLMSLDKETPLGVLVFEGVPEGDLDSLALQILESAKLMSRFVEFGLSFWDSKTMAMVDDLTELYNQRFLPVVLDNEISRARRSGKSFSLLFMDLDYFKNVNDTKGHWIGSKLLREVGLMLKGMIRSCDYGFRYGGDEFVIVLPDTDLKGGQVVAERIRDSIEKKAFVIDGHQVTLTVSVGLASFPDQAQSRDQIIQMADQAMYHGKRKSRNVVYVAS